MWKRLSLRARILVLLIALVLTTIGGGVVTLWHNEAMDSLLTSLIDKNVASYHAAEELENALLQQKGYLTYYFLDGNPAWLEEIKRYNGIFEDWLEKARKSAYTEAMRETIGQIEVQYHQYVINRERVISLYREGKRDAGAKLHWEVRHQYVEILNLSNRYKVTHEYAISRVRTESQARARFINAFALVAMPAVAVLGLLLAYILIKQILGPIRQLALATAPASPGRRVPDEVEALSSRVHSLIEDVDQAQTELERSQEHLLQSGKWAMVGKLAAGVAHSIRNPLTSVNMRLFSLKRSLAMSSSQQEDFEVISEEIRHIDTIVRNFLEFSRPPKLKMQRVSPSAVVDMALVLLRYRLESYGVEVKLIRRPPAARDLGRSGPVEGSPGQPGAQRLRSHGERRRHHHPGRGKPGAAPGTGGGYPGERQWSRHPRVHPGPGLSTLFQHQRGGHRPGPQHCHPHHRRPRRPVGTEIQKE